MMLSHRTSLSWLSAYVPKPNQLSTFILRTDIHKHAISYLTSSSAVAERPRDASVIEYFVKSLKIT